MSDTRLRVAATALSAKLAEINDHPSYHAVWDLCYAHGLRYDGPNYFAELEALRSALSPAVSGRAEPKEGE